MAITSSCSFDVFLADYHKNIDKNCDKQLNILSHSIGEKFLKLVICLESLLLFNEFNENKKEYLKQRSYFLFLCTKNDEKNIQDFIDELPAGTSAEEMEEIRNTQQARILNALRTSLGQEFYDAFMEDYKPVRGDDASSSGVISYKNYVPTTN